MSGSVAAAGLQVRYAPATTDRSDVEPEDSRIFYPGMQPLEAAISLLSHVVDPDGICRHNPGSYEWMDGEQIAGRQMGPRGMFGSHWCAKLPNTLDGRAVTTTIHQFTMLPEAAKDVNVSLHELGARNYGARDGISRSNEGGYHSVHDIFQPRDMDAWYRRVHDATLEALAIVEPQWGAQGAQTSVDVDGPPGAAVLQGWINASGPYDFNTLHHHGGREKDWAKWSAVYFVASGRGSEDVDGVDNAGLLGSLLFQTQPDSHRPHFEFLPVAPVPGSLWLFPAYLPHAVMPRALLGLGASVNRVDNESTSEEAPGTSRSSLRVSVAVNIIPTRGTTPPGSTANSLPAEVDPAEGQHSAQLCLW